MIRRPPRSTRTDTLFPYTTLCRSLLISGGDPNAPLNDSAELDNPRIVFEYPENIHLFGLSFNTSIGDYSLQGEVAYRPNLPLQISIADLGFAALGPTLQSCGNTVDGGCKGTHFGQGFVDGRSEEHTSELQSLMSISYAVFCLKKNNTHITLAR